MIIVNCLMGLIEVNLTYPLLPVQAFCLYQTIWGRLAPGGRRPPNSVVQARRLYRRHVSYSG
ncbi:MAG: hypothetical protein WEB89_07590 [Balneolales bacterium]